MSALDPAGWGRPGLGVWTIRDLVGHTSRALRTIESYLGAAPTAGTVALADPVDYYRATAAQLADPDAVAERGRQAGAALGADPSAAVRSLAQRVSAQVVDSADHRLVATPIGKLTLLDYLPTRTFELTVHSLDIAHAGGIDIPGQLDAPIAASLVLAARMSGGSDRASVALLALTGRQALPKDFNVV